MTDYTAVPGKYRAMQWTGDNTAAFEAWVQSFYPNSTFTADQWTVSPSDHYGTDVLTLAYTRQGFTYLTVSTPLGGWAVFGPYWGTDPVVYAVFGGRAPWFAVTDAEFQRQYAVSA
jgi:hypothetical protein